MKFVRIFLGWLVASLYLLLSLTWKKRIINHSSNPDVLSPELASKMVFAHWHGDELAVIGLVVYKKFSALSSLSKDGTIMAAALAFLGIKVVRGSSSRGGARGLVGLIQAARLGYRATLAIDGPRGPYHEPKKGIFVLAKSLGASIVPARVTCDRAWVFRKSWNKAYLPKPFAKITYHFAEVLPVTDADEPKLVPLLKERME